jgi:hypothetical protein
MGRKDHARNHLLYFTLFVMTEFKRYYFSKMKTKSFDKIYSKFLSGSNWGGGSITSLDCEIDDKNKNQYVNIHVIIIINTKKRNKTAP